MDEGEEGTSAELHETDQLHQFEDLVDTADARQPNQIGRVAAAEHQFERQNGDQVEEEPTLDVVYCNFAPLLNDLKVIVVDGCIENDHYVQQEHTVHNVVDDGPSAFHLLVEGKLNWRDDARIYQYACDDDVPVCLVFVLWRDEAVAGWLAFNDGFGDLVLKNFAEGQNVPTFLYLFRSLLLLLRDQ